MSVRPSSAVISMLKPHSASESEIVRSMNRSSPLRLKSECGCSCSTKTTSPASPSGISSAFSEKWILCWSGEPLGMWTSSVSCTFCCLKMVPRPPHSSQCFCTCWIIGPIRIVWILTPWPPHELHRSTPRCLSITLRVSRSLRERDLEGVHHVLSLLDALRLSPPARVEHVENVAGASAVAAPLQGLLTTSVVNLALPLVAQDVECL